MFKLCCSALGVGDCPFAAEGGTIEEAIVASKAHISSTHRDMMTNMNQTMTIDEIDSRLESVVRGA